MRALFVTVALMGLLAGTTPARAELPADAAAAEALFARGRNAAGRGDLQQACDAFEQSQRLDPAAGTLMNWAMCETRQNKLASAWQHFSQAERLLSLGDDRLGFVRAQIRKLVPRLPRLTVRLAPTMPTSARVLKSGDELDPKTFGIPTPTDPGDFELLVVCPGRATRKALVSVREREAIEVTLEPGPELQTAHTTAPFAAAAAPHPAVHSTLQHDLGLSLLATGSLGVGLALASGVLVAQRKDTAEQHCEANRCDASGLRAAQSGERWLLVNTVAWSVGGAALASGAALLFTAPGNARARAGQPSATLQLLPGSVTFSYAGRY
jgi:hypothetical protein